MDSAPHSLSPKAEEALAHCCDSLASCSSGQRDALFAAREALVQFTGLLGPGGERYRKLCEGMQRMLGQLLRRDSLSEKEALEFARMVMSFMRVDLLGPETAPEQAKGVPGFTGRTIPPPLAPPAAALPSTPAQDSLRASTMGNQASANGRPQAAAAYGQAPAAPVPAAPVPVAQAPAAPAGPSEPRFVNEGRLGEILCGQGMITPEQLDRALVLQRVAKRRLGEVLVVMQAITQEQLHQALEHQRNAGLALAQANPSMAPQPPGPAG